MQTKKEIEVMTGAELKPEVKQNDEEFGVCDECGEYTEELVLIDGTWVCKDCSNMF